MVRDICRNVGCFQRSCASDDPASTLARNVLHRGKPRVAAVSCRGGVDVDLLAYSA